MNAFLHGCKCQKPEIITGLKQNYCQEGTFSRDLGELFTCLFQFLLAVDFAH